jgi:predicted O-methyltransferase YrrM
VGAGTLALARQLPDAEVIALDVDGEMLKRIQDKARAAGLAVRPRRPDGPHQPYGLAGP